MSLQEAIKANEDLANKEMGAILSEPLEFDTVYQHIETYVRCRFLLLDEKCDSENLAELSELGLRKLLKLQRDEDLQEVSLTCTGSSSKSRRKVLLMLAIRKALGFTWDPVESAYIETLTQLTEGVIRHLEEKRFEAKTSDESDQ